MPPKGRKGPILQGLSQGFVSKKQEYANNHRLATVTSQGKRTTELAYVHSLPLYHFPSLKWQKNPNQNWTSHSKFIPSHLVICQLKLIIHLDKRKVLRLCIKYSQWSQAVNGLAAVRTTAGTRAAGISTDESQTFQRLSLPPQVEAKVSLPEVLVIN